VLRVLVVGWGFRVSMSPGNSTYRCIPTAWFGANVDLGSDPGAPDAATANGMISLSFGKLFEKVSL
jgi:hypothetical protein